MRYMRDCAGRAANANIVSPRCYLLMLVIDPTLHSTSTPSDVATSEYGLRMFGRGGSEFACDLPIGKTTLGSGAKCVLRIQQPGVQPIHCLIQRTADSLTVQRWAEPSRINGESFEQATLAIGDRLMIGSVELEVVGSVAAGDADGINTDIDLMSHEWRGSEAVGAIEHDGLEVDRPTELAEEILASNDASLALIDRCDQLIQDSEPFDVAVSATADRELPEASSLELNAQCDELRNEVAALSDQLSEFEGSRDSLSEENLRLRHETDALREEHTHVWDKVAKLQDEVTTLTKERSLLAEGNDRLSADSGPFLAEADELRTELARLLEIETERAAQNRNLNDRVQAADGRLAQLDSELAQLRQELARQAAILEARDVECRNLRDEIERLRDEADARKSAPTQNEHIPPAADANVGTDAAPLFFYTPTQIDGSFAVADEPQKELRASNGFSMEPESDEASPFAPLVIPRTSTERHESPSELHSELTEERAEVWQFKSESSPESPTDVRDSDDEAEGPAKQTVPSQSLFSPLPRRVDPRPVVVEPANQPAAKLGLSPGSNVGDEEESIEDYMAKLMQRLRGEAAAGVPSVPSTAARPSSDAPRQEAPDAGRPLPPPAPIATRNEPVQVVSPTKVTAAEYKPGGPAPERAADLQAFRELANASARSAIAVHTTKIHRRSAVTKVIVSILASMTGLWLILQVPDWRDLQFISACVLLLVAAYWVGQTVQTLMESIRAGNFDGNDYDWSGDGLRDAPLPIDIERERW